MFHKEIGLSTNGKIIIVTIILTFIEGQLD